MSETQSAGLRLALHRSPESLSEDWDALADRLAASPFLRPGWLLAWSRAFAPGALSVLTATERGKLVGLLPLIERRGARIAPVNWHTPLFSCLAADDTVAAALAESFISGARTRADISFVDQGDPILLACRQAAARARRSVLERTVLRSPYVPLGGLDWESFRGSLDRKLRKEIERCGRRLGERGVLRLEVADGQAGLDSFLEEGFRLEGSQWKRERATAILSDPRTARFYTEIARWASLRGWLALAFLRLDGRPIAFDLCLESPTVTYVLKGGFDPAFSRFGPGMLLTYESLRRAIERGASSYELLGDEDSYKLSWTRASRARVRLQVFGRSPGGQTSQLAWTHGRSIIQRARALTERSTRRRA